MEHIAPANKSKVVAEFDSLGLPKGNGVVVPGIGPATDGVI